MRSAIAIATLASLALPSALGGSSSFAQEPAASARCDILSFASANVDGAAIRSVDVVTAGGFTPSSGPAAGFQDLPAFCRVSASTSSGKASLINFELWVPQRWNGKLVATGNGGYSNVPSFRDMAYALSQGYAAVGGDTGHQTPTPDDLLWGVDRPEQIADWGTRSIHAIVAPAKRIVAVLRNKAPARAYFYGCSTGGHQAYAQIQRYPKDLDGVIAGAPGNNRIRLNVGFLWQYLANHDRSGGSTPIVPASKLPMITRAIVAKCDALDGVADGIVDDPRSCEFDPAALTCASSDGPDCLTAAQVSAMKRMYEGARNPRTGEQIYPGWPKSSEALTTSSAGQPAAGWQQYWGGAEPARAAFWRHWIFADPKWDWWTFDFDRGVALADRKVGALIDQTDPNIGAFKSRGGKAIVYQGWQDPVTSALDTIAYYEKVRARQGSQRETDRFFRLFLVPGMGHCAGGPGATNFGNTASPSPIVDANHDLLAALDAWVERGVAPSRLIASRVVDGATVRTRPLCPYPQKAVYRGTGSTEDESSFACR
ncbi:MAG TPA: tannase/feruloyl esterase family alpha/beta hydrolase [Vicinamibacterales bacterium]|jgi:feruloyl esterase